MSFYSMDDIIMSKYSFACDLSNLIIYLLSVYYNDIMINKYL